MSQIGVETPPYQDQELTRLELLARPILDQAPEAVVVCEEGGRDILYANQAARHLGGDDPLHQPFAQAFPLRFADPDAETAWEATLRGRFLHGLEARLHRRDGEFFDLLLSGGPILDARRGLLGIALVLVDVTASKVRVRELEHLAGFPWRNPNPIIECTADGTLVYANEVVRRVAEALGRPPQDILPDEVTDLLHRCLTTGDVVTDWESEVEGQFFLWSFVPNPAAETVRCYGKEITRLKQVEELLRRDEERYLTLALSAKGIIWTTNAQGEVVEDIPSWRAYTGQTVAEVRGEGWSSGLHPEDRSKTLGVWRRAVETRSPYETEYRLRGQDGVYRYFAACGAPVLNRDGTVREWIGTCTDITEQKATEEALRRSEERFALAVQAAKEGIWEWDLQTAEIFLSPRWKAMLGYEDHEMAPSYEEWVSRLHPADRERVLALVHDFQEGRITHFESEYRLRHKDGSYRWIQCQGLALRDADGKPYRLAGSNMDITERKRAEETILRLNRKLTEHGAQLEAANKELEAFAYSVSHDLRAPLRSIDGFSQVLLEDYADRLPNEGKDSLQRVRAAAKRMTELIDGILVLSRLTRQEMHRETVDLSALARAVAADLRKERPERDVEFVIAEGLTDQGDPVLLRAVLENLLGNAWKFTSKHPKARIEFGAGRQMDGKPHYFVRDDGAGFDMAYAAKLFAPFQRLHSQAEFSGTGIGLATVQRIIHRHGGQVSAEGKVEGGATFYFTLE